jgi:hypothetical protein
MHSAASFGTDCDVMKDVAAMRSNAQDSFEKWTSKVEELKTIASIMTPKFGLEK